MYWLDNDSGVTTPPAIPPVVSATRQYFTEGGGGDQPSIPGGEWFNMMTDELLQVLTLGGIAPDKADHTQLAKAIQAIAFSAAPVGSPLPWPLATPPAGFLLMNGQTFNPTTYPKLALAYPSGTLPDLRGEFIRGWDNGRGVDAGRALLSPQSFALQNITGGVGEITENSNQYATEINAASGAFATESYQRNIIDVTAFVQRIAKASVSFDASRVAQTANETRPKNTSFNYIVRAA